MQKTMQETCLDSGSTSSRATLLDIPVLDKERGNARQGARRDGKDKRIIECLDVRMHDGALDFLWESEDDGDGLLDGLEDFWVERASEPCELFDELVVEDCTSDGDTDDTAEELEEREEGRGLRDESWGVCVFCLNRHDGQLERQSQTESEEDLVANEDGAARVFVDGEEESCTDGTE